MRAFTVARVDTSQGFPLFCGTLEAELRTGDSVFVVDGAGTREAGTVSAIAVEDATEGSTGARLLDHGTAGQSVRVAVRRPRTAAIAAEAVVEIARS